MSGAKKTLRIGAALAALAVGVGAVVWWWNRNHRELVIAGVVEIQAIHVGSKVGGRVEEVLIREGEMVEAGTVLVRFEVPELEARCDQLAAALVQAEADLERWRNGPRLEEIVAAEAAHGAAAARVAMLQEWTRPEEMRQGEAEFDATKAEQAVAEASLRRIVDLHREQVASAQQLDDARAACDAARARVRAAEARIELLEAGARAEEIARAREEARGAKAQFDLLKAGTRPELIAEARARCDAARAALAEARAQLREGEVRAPSRARVEVVSVRKGDLVPSGKAVVRLLQEGDLWVKAYCPEPDLGYLRVGGPAAVRVDGFPGRTFPGEIMQIAGESEYTPRNIQSLDERWNQVFAVKIRVDAPAGVLKPGMAALAVVPWED